MTRVLGTIVLILLVVGLGLYAAGWLSWDNTSDRTTIGIETKEIQEAADDVVEKGKRFVDETIENVQGIGDSSDDSQQPVRPDALEVEPVEPVEPVETLEPVEPLEVR